MLKKIFNYFKKNWHYPILAVVAVCFFVGISSFNYFTQKNDFVKWSSPDEAANYTFAKLYSQEAQLEFFEKYNIIASDIIHPRSYRSDFGWLKPISFLGMPLIYGKIASLTSYKILPYLTPFFAVLGIIFFYLFIKEIFGKREALISAMLLASFPPFIYYSARSMFHNVLFMVLLIVSFYFAVIAIKKINKKKELGPETSQPSSFFMLTQDIYAGLAGACLGLAIMVRPSELIWLIPVWLIIWLFNFKKIGFIKLIIFIAFLLFSLLPMLCWNKILYQSYFRGGYNEMNQSILNIASFSSEIATSGIKKIEIIKNNLIEIKNNFFYFGFSPTKSIKIFYFYFVNMFYWLFWSAVFGFLIFSRKIKKWESKHYVFLISYFVASAILLFYYGSWNFYDNPDPHSKTIGNSYTRYWLLIYLGAMPFASIFIIALSDIFRKKIIIYSCRVLIVIIIFFISIKFILFGSDEGLINSAKKRIALREEYNQVLNLTENRAIIITQYHDKLFFPERKVIVGLFDDENMIKQYAILTKYLPVYYYNFTLPKKSFDYLNNSRLSKFNLQIAEVKKITNDFTLYKLKQINELTD